LTTLVDGSVWIDLLRGNTTSRVDRLPSLIDDDDLLVGDLLHSDRDFEPMERLLGLRTI
jgi:hypothetical protein